MSYELYTREHYMINLSVLSSNLPFKIDKTHSRFLHVKRSTKALIINF